jgi:formylglycine-generating enzyme required for sulfatase activity
MLHATLLLFSSHRGGMDNSNISVTQNVDKVESGGTVIGVQVIYQGEPVTIPSQEAIRLHRADLAKIETYHRWADEFYIHEEGKVLPLFASPYEDDGGRKREDLLQTIRAHQRLLVLGEPGMGKTVALERMVWETAKADEGIVPILVQLLYFQGLDLIELIRAALNETGRLTFDNAKSVRAFLRETKCLILFDGLNETPGKQREQVIGAIANFMREYPEHRYVVTSRSQDELWRKLRSAELIQDAVVVQTINDVQAQGYLQAHLGNEKGQALYDRLDASLKSLARTPLLLKLIKDAGGASDQLPRNRGELFDKYVMNKLLEREQKLELKETPEAKKKALAHLAFVLQLNHQLACDREWAEKILAEKGLGAKTDTLLKEALLHGLLIQQTLPDKQLLRFIHQSVQEYFVALTLLSEVKIEKNANLFQGVSRRFSKHNLTEWAKDTWWSESFVQLAGLVSDADWLARKIATGASPWLAWWCVQEGRDVPKNTREMIEARSIKLLHSEDVAERRRAVQTLAQIKNERVLEPLLIAAGDEDKEVAGLGLQALLENDDAVHAVARKVLQSDSKLSWRGALRFLRTQSKYLYWHEIPAKVYGDTLEYYGQPAVWIPAGAFLMGSDKSKDSKAITDELPQHSVTLPGYWIGRFPVTVSQWKAFLKDSGYKSDERGSQDPDNHPARYVNWDDALAYCKWLSEKSGLPVTLPSETEWEKAARGGDGRIYPWGNEFDKNKCNTNESGIKNTTPVGKYSPAGDSPYGCADMVGNVWEWIRSKYKFYPSKVDDGTEGLEGTAPRVMRGGSWNRSPDYARVSYRNLYNYQFDRKDNFGFRVVVRPPSF